MQEGNIMKGNNLTFDNIDLPDIDNRLYIKNDQKKNNKPEQKKKSLIDTIKAFFTRRK